MSPTGFHSRTSFRHTAGWCVRLVVLLLGLLALTQCTQPRFAVCTTDADCADGEACVAAGCIVRVPTEICPLLCRMDEECKSCAGGRTRCINGACKAPVVCPANCTTHTDCAVCSGGKTSCLQGVCGNPLTCPASCAADADCLACSDGKTSCLNGACGKAICPSRCARDRDCELCSDKRTLCLRAACRARPTTCPQSCWIDDDCAGCATGKQSCVAGVCGKVECTADQSCPVGKKCVWKACVEPPSVGQSCPDGTCPDGMACWSGSCFQNCTSNPSICQSNTDGRTFCLPAFVKNNRQVSLCFAAAKEGELCLGASFNTSRQAFCETGQEPYLYCNSLGVCESAQSQNKVGAICSRRGDPTEPIRVCNREAGLACDERGNVPKCVQANTVGIGAQCDPYGILGSVPTLCSGNLLCIPFYPPYAVGRCHSSCTVGKQDACPLSGDACVPLSYPGNRQGVCLQQGCTDSCQLTGYECRSGQCFPPRPEGNTGFGQSCGDAICQKDLECWSPSGRGQGYCTPVCTNDGGCPPYRDGNGKLLQASCVRISQSKRYCIFVCQPGNQNADCPASTTCTNVTGGYICLPGQQDR